MSFISDLVDVVEHLVHTHPTFNLALSQDEALAKLAVVKVADAAHDAEHVELPQLVTDLKAALADLEQVTNPLTPVAPPVPTTPFTS